MPHDDHHHNHNHPHANGGATAQGRIALAWVGSINLLWACAQAMAGLAIGSTALLSDSVHNLGDAAGLVLAWLAASLATRRATARRTWGWHRAELLAGFANALLVLVGGFAVGAGAIWRLLHPVALEGLSVSAWAVGGIVVNALSAWWIGGHGQNLNSRGAFLHLVSDAVVSAAVVIGGVAVHFSGLAWLDPALAVCIAVWLVRGTWPFFRETLDGLMDAVPLRHDLAKIEHDLSRIEGVESLHDLHLWPMGGERSALSVHLIHRVGCDPSSILEKALDRLHHDHHGIHATVQVEPTGVETWHGHEVCLGRE